MNDSSQLDYPKLDASKLHCKAVTHFYAQNDVIKLALKRNYENCDIEADLAAMLVPTKVNNHNITKHKHDLTGKENINIQFTTFNAQLVTKNNRHLLKATPKTIPVTRRDRLLASDSKKYVYGKLNADKLVQTLKNMGLVSVKLVEKSTIKKDESIHLDLDDPDDITPTTLNNFKYLIEINKNNSIEIDVNANQINVNCENEEIRVKIKDALLKCLNSL
jgi:hypothetical protein